jgi:hypothetical protein
LGCVFLRAAALWADDAPAPTTNAAPAVTPAAPANATSSAPDAATAPPVGPDGLILPSDNAHPPYMAVFKNSVNGSKIPNGITRNAAYAAWLNRTLVWAEDTCPSTRWDSIEGGGWQFDPWGAWVQENPARRLILCVPMVPGKWDGSGTDAGDGAHQPITLELGASGAYNIHYQKLAETLVKHHMGNTILRLGWEFNGGWYAWKVNSKAKADAYAEFWRQIVKTMRAVPGAEKLEFAFNPANGCFDAALAYPGDDYVDYIGPDDYDDAYAPNTYPWPKDATPDQIEAAQEKAWTDVVYSKQAHGLAYWAEFAKEHHKPMCIPEWGVDQKPDHHGGLDDPYYIEQMYKFINDPANNVGWHSYFDVQAPDGGHMLSPKEDGTVVTKFPNSAAKFHELFSLPASATAPAAAPTDATNPTPVAASPPPGPTTDAAPPAAPTTGFTVMATPKGILIAAGDAGVYVMSYPRLLNPVDGGATPAPDQITLKPDGTGATLTYKPSGTATLDKQPDGSWLYHFTDIPGDRIKFAFGTRFPKTNADGETTWSFDGAPPTPFPESAGEVNLYQGNPKTFALAKGRSGFTITYPKQTWVVLTDQRVWGKDFFGYIDFLYFPKKQHVPEISYAFRIDDLSTALAAAPAPAQP